MAPAKDKQKATPLSTVHESHSEGDDVHEGNDRDSVDSLHRHQIETEAIGRNLTNVLTSRGRSRSSKRVEDKTSKPAEDKAKDGPKSTKPAKDKDRRKRFSYIERLQSGRSSITDLDPHSLTFPITWYPLALDDPPNETTYIIMDAQGFAAAANHRPEVLLSDFRGYMYDVELLKLEQANIREENKALREKIASRKDAYLKLKEAHTYNHTEKNQLLITVDNQQKEIDGLMRKLESQTAKPSRLFDLSSDEDVDDVIRNPTGDLNPNDLQDPHSFTRPPPPARPQLWPSSDIPQ